MTLYVDLLGVYQWVTEEVAAEGWMIVALGDSVASGEGVPDRSTPEERNGRTRRCHCSARHTGGAGRPYSEPKWRSSRHVRQPRVLGCDDYQGSAGAVQGHRTRPAATQARTQITELKRILTPVESRCAAHKRGSQRRGIQQGNPELRATACAAQIPGMLLEAIALSHKAPMQEVVYDLLQSLRTNYVKLFKAKLA